MGGEKRGRERKSKKEQERARKSKKENGKERKKASKIARAPPSGHRDN